MVQPKQDAIIGDRDPDNIIGWDVDPQTDGTYVEVWFDDGYRTTINFIEKVTGREAQRSMESIAPDKEGLPETTDCYYCGEEIVEGRDEKHMIDEGLTKQPMCGQCWTPPEEIEAYNEQVGS